jgi:hypothetical protein
MKVVAALICHYGKEYMAQCVAALDPLVDQFIVLYAPNGSQGYHADIPCPESEDELRACCDSVASKLVWHKEDFHNEGQHRNKGYALAGDALILQFDCDEIVDTERMGESIKAFADGGAREGVCSGYVHFWRSFSWACKDVWQPSRLLNTRGYGKVVTDAPVYHMSYAQRPEIVEYKIKVSGHHDEIRKRWFRDKFLANEKNDVHPTVNLWWDAKPFDKTTLPPLLKSHPNYDKEVIE